MSLPDNVVDALSDSVFHRHNDDVDAALERLGVTPSNDLKEFYKTYAGPFWSDSLGVELADIADDNPNIVSLTELARSQFAFPKRMLVLTQLSPGKTVHVLDTESDEVFVVDFEGGEELLVNGKLEPRWRTFAKFL